MPTAAARQTPTALARRKSDDLRRPENTWAASQESIQKDEKELMANYFANHDFLVKQAKSPALSRRPAATIFVIQGTSPNLVVKECLEWIAEHSDDVAYHLTWYTNSATVPATLHDFRVEHPELRLATHVHLLPGTVDLHLQAQLSAEAVHYAAGITRRFTYQILSGHSLDLLTGEVKFNFDQEIPVQKACANLEATEKFLFLDSEKFIGEGAVGYNLADLLRTCNTLVIYTVRTKPDVTHNTSAQVKEAFDRLAEGLLTNEPHSPSAGEEKTIQLTIVGRDHLPSEEFKWSGFLAHQSGAPH